MSLEDLLREGRLQRHSTSAEEVEALLGIVRRSLQDACVEAVSADARFAMAYNAALQLASIPLRCAGYRPRGAGAHLTTFQALTDTMGTEQGGRAARASCRFLEGMPVRGTISRKAGGGAATGVSYIDGVLEVWYNPVQPRGAPWHHLLLRRGSPCAPGRAFSYFCGWTRSTVLSGWRY